MHIHLLNAAFVLAMISYGMATDINSTLPEKCQTICSPVMQLFTTCNGDISSMSGKSMSGDGVGTIGKDKDTESPGTISKERNSKRANIPITQRTGIRAEAEQVQMDCICNNKSFAVAVVVGLCSSCMGQNAGTRESFSNFLFANDMNRIMSRCSFPLASYAPSATTVLSGVQVQATKPAISMMAGPDSQTSTASRTSNMIGAWPISVVVAGFGLGAALVATMV